MDRMYLLSSFALLVISVPVLGGTGPTPMIQSIVSELRFCMDSSPSTGNGDVFEQYLPMVLTDDLPSTLGQKCFLTCLYNRFGLLKDGYLDTETTKNLVETIYKDKQDEKTMANIAINICHAAAVPDVSNPCEIGLSLKSCFMDSKKKGQDLRKRTSRKYRKKLL